MGLGGMVATGVALGGGSALGHHIVGSMLGGHGRAQYYPVESSPNEQLQSSQTQPLQDETNLNAKQLENPCIDYNIQFINCLKENQDNISRCQNQFTDMISCEKSFRSISPNTNI